MTQKDDEQRPRLAGAAGRAAFFPARAAARAWRAPLEEAVDEVLSAPEVARVIDRSLAGSLPEELARSLVRHRVLERIVAELAESGELERLVTAALASPSTNELTDKVLASDETQRALHHLASVPSSATRSPSRRRGWRTRSSVASAPAPSGSTIGLRRSCAAPRELFTRCMPGSRRAPSRWRPTPH